MFHSSCGVVGGVHIAQLRTVRKSHLGFLADTSARPPQNYRLTQLILILKMVLIRHLEKTLVIINLISAGMSLSSTTFTTTSSGGSQKTTILQGKDLKEVVLSATQKSDENQWLDLNGIMWLEHINLVVGNKGMAEQFYYDYLGLSRDKGGSFHANLGQQQFHLAENGEPPQRVTGSIGLCVPSLDTIRDRTAEAMTSFSDSKFQVLDDTEECLTVTCPWGNRLHLYDIKHDDNVPLACESSQKMITLHSKGGAYGPHRMSVRGGPGIRYIEIRCRPGSNTAISNFYQQMLNCQVQNVDICETQALVVSVGPGVHLVYVEDKNITEEDFEAMKGVHICIYVNEFKNLYHRLAEKKLIWTNPRFTHLDSCDTWDEAAASRTLRFKDILDLESSQKIIELEHETRPLRHGQYLKVPYYVPK